MLVHQQYLGSHSSTHTKNIAKPNTLGFPTNPVFTTPSRFPRNSLVQGSLRGNLRAWYREGVRGISWRTRQTPQTSSWDSGTKGSDQNLTGSSSVSPLAFLAAASASLQRRQRGVQRSLSLRLPANQEPREPNMA